MCVCVVMQLGTSESRSETPGKFCNVLREISPTDRVKNEEILH